MITSILLLLACFNQDVNELKGFHSINSFYHYLQGDTLHIHSESALFSETDSIYYQYSSAYMDKVDQNHLVEKDKRVYNIGYKNKKTAYISPNHQQVFSHDYGDSILRVGPGDTIFIIIENRYNIKPGKHPVKKLYLEFNEKVIVGEGEMNEYQSNKKKSGDYFKYARQESYSDSYLYPLVYNKGKYTREETIHVTSIKQWRKYCQ